ncbi:MAG: TetR/AcrR family transcriptional regulator [Lachnospiraceae bacterium]|nr:TetR/AcrR family transcriptional regulator [Lachnospiraceae bacterium]
MKKQPEITEKTRQKFVDAFWPLIEEKPIAKIAVSELTRRAGYNRSTFYEYFIDTDDLVTYVETKLLEQIKQTVLQASPEEDSPGELFQNIFEAMNERMYLLLGPNGDSSFLEKVKAELFPLIVDFFRISEDTPHFDYLICFASSALLGLLQLWNKKGKDLSTEEISTMMQDLVLQGLITYMTPSFQDTYHNEAERPSPHIESGMRPAVEPS